MSRPKAVTASGADQSTTAAPKGPPRAIPPVGQLAALDFPDITHTRLANGIAVDYAQRTAVPVTQLALSFDAGDAADAPTARGLQGLMLAMLDEGTDDPDCAGAGRGRRSGSARRSALRAALDRSTVMLSALSANLAPSLALLGRRGQGRRPSRPARNRRGVRTQTLTAIAQVQKDPNGIARALLPALLYGADHPYAALRGGDAAAVDGATREELLVVPATGGCGPTMPRSSSSRTARWREIMPLLEARSSARGRRRRRPRASRRSAPSRRAPATSRIVLIDRPGSPQSVIGGGQITPLDPRSDILALSSANDVLGGDFLAASTWTCARPRAGPTASAAAPRSTSMRCPTSSMRRSRPTAPAIRSPRSNDAVRSFLGDQGRHAGGTGADTRQQHQRASRPVRDVGRGARRDDVSNDLSAVPTIITRRWPASIARQTAAGLDQAIRARGRPRGLRLAGGRRRRQDPPAARRSSAMPIEVIKPR